MSVSRPTTRHLGFLAIAIATAFAAAGCTVHPAGEARERDLAAREGRPFVERIDDRPLPALSDAPTPDELVRYTALASPELEQKYWEWKSAIEQIPQDGTQPTNLVLFAGAPLTRGSTAFNRTTVTAGNDPMSDIQWPSKPTTAARRALDKARAAGYRFRQAKADLRAKVLAAYSDYALAAELTRLAASDVQLLNSTAAVAEANVASGRTTQSASLTAQNEAELAQNALAELQASLPGLRAAVDVAMGREVTAPLALPAALPGPRPIVLDADALLRSAAGESPALAALDADTRAKIESKRLAELQRLPDFSLSAGTDLSALAQSLSGMVTVPMLRQEAINAAVAQAEANLRASEAMRRQSRLDLQGQIVSDVAAVGDLRRQIALLETGLVPRAESIVVLDRSAYEVGRGTVSDLLASQRSLTSLKRLDANLRAAHERRLLEIERAIGRPLE